MEVQGNTAICERGVVKRLMPPPIEEDAKWFERQLKRMRPELCGWILINNPYRQSHCKKPIKLSFRKNTVLDYHFPWSEDKIENLVIGFTSLSVKMTGEKVISDNAGHSFQDNYSSQQKCQVP